MSAERDQYLDALQRLKAEFDNFRKRNDRERQSIATGATREVVRGLLPVMDNLERAVAALGDQGEQIVAGLEMVRGQLAGLLAGHGVEEIPASGEQFDPTVHEAIASTPSPDHPEGTVIEVIEKGYRQADHVLRPTRVVIASGRRRRRRRREGSGRTGWMISTPRSASRRPRAPMRSRRRIASWPGCTTRTPTRATPRPRSASRRSPTPTTCSRTPTSGREYDARLQFGGRANGGFGGGPAGRAAVPARAASATSPTCSRASSATRAAGRRTAEPTPRRGADVEVEVNLSFDQAMAGVQVPVSVETPVACADCGGSGAKPGTSPRLCPECKGRGVRGRDGGSFAFSEPCPRCGGNGTVIDDPCPTCHGTGNTTTRSQIKVKIPPGVKDGTRIRLKGRGQAGTRGGPAGDLQVITRVAPSRLYTRKGDDLVINVPVTFAEAALGAQVEVPTLDGRVKLTVPAGSADGRSLRIGGKGAPRLKGEGRGDLIATLRLDVPRELSQKQKDALEKFAKLDARDPRETLFS